MPQSVCLTVAEPLMRPSGASPSSNVDRLAPPGERQVAAHGQALAGALDRGRTELDRVPAEDLVDDVLLDLTPIVVAELHDPAGALAHLQ